jgi:uncharacterized membrane protein YphA (DoxX/SURF4 family)
MKIYMIKIFANKQDLATLLLRSGLVVILLYAAIGSFADPKEWIGYFPSILTDHLPAATLLKIFSVYELVLAAWLLSGVYVRWAALLCAITLGGIVLANFELFAITFRDIALIFAALALSALTWEAETK